MGANVNKEFKSRFAVISETTMADNELVAAATGKKIRVLSYVVNAAGGANTVTFKSAAVAISGAMDLLDNESLESHCSPFGVFETAAGAALNMAQTGATLVAGHLTYVLV